MTDLAELEQKLKQIKNQIHEAEEKASRAVDSVSLLAVSKGQSAESIRQFYQLGQRDFGENYLQEALEKMEALQDLDICWHYIGSIQSKKAKTIALHFDWVHSLSRIKVAEELNTHRSPDISPLNVCVQVNLSGEASKSGLNKQELDEITQRHSQWPQLKFRGLMTMPPAGASDMEKLNLYQQLHQLLVTTNQKHGLKMDTLSMGMSNDFNLAIAAGSTIVRVGQALFGPRQPINRTI